MRPALQLAAAVTWCSVATLTACGPSVNGGSGGAGASQATTGPSSGAGGAVGNTSNGGAGGSAASGGGSDGLGGSRVAGVAVGSGPGTGTATSGGAGQGGAGQGGSGPLDAISLLGAQLPPDWMADPQSVYVYVGDEPQSCNDPGDCPLHCGDMQWQVELILSPAEQHPGVVALDQSNCTLTFVLGDAVGQFFCGSDLAMGGTLTINTIDDTGITGHLVFVAQVDQINVNQDVAAPRCQ